MDRFKTDFLCASSTFALGAGSVLNLFGRQIFDYNCSEDPDAIAIAQDWRMVGQDLRDALKQARVDSKLLLGDERRLHT